MYYLFIKNEKELKTYKEKFDKTKKAIEEGKTPVFNEVTNAKTLLIETVPYQGLCGIFLIFGTSVLNKFLFNQTLSIALVLVINSLCNCLGNYVFTILKHHLRIKLCKRLKIEPNNKNIAVMESLEYQTVE